MALIAAPPIATGKKEGNIVVCGDSLTSPSNAQDVVSAMYWNQWSIPQKTAPPTTRAGFGWSWANISTPSSVNIINAAYDASAPWNIVFVWIGPNNAVAGDSPADTYAAGQAWAAQIDSRYRFLYSTVIPNGSASMPAGWIASYNSLLLTPPYLGAGHFVDAQPIDITPLNANPLVVTNSTYYYADHIHLTKAGQTVVALPNAFAVGVNFSDKINAYLATLP